MGKLVLSSGHLQNSWSKISEIHDNPDQASGLGYKIYEEAKYTFVVFVEPQIGINCSVSILLSGSEDQNLYHFLCSEKKSSFSLHQSAFQLFASAYSNLSKLKSKVLEFEKPVILTGAALGGSVASLFTLWLLETIDPKQNHPLCGTFGSPLIVDANLQQILQNSVWNSCFLHVAVATETPSNADFKPFGTFLICFNSECICIEDPEAVIELLTGDSTDPVELRNYGEILQRLDQSSMVDSGLMVDDIMKRMEERVVAKYDQLKKLNDTTMLMAQNTNYLQKEQDRLLRSLQDRSLFRSQYNILNTEKLQNDFWISMVEEVEKMPQTEKSILKTRCLFAGNNKDG